MRKYPDVEHPNTNKSRLWGYGSAYFEIAEKEYSRYVSLDQQHSETKDEEELSHIEDQSFEAALKTILFSALCVEASINDYAAWQLGDGYFDDHICNLDVVSKWVVIPNLVARKSMDKSGPGFNSLRKLIKARNLLIHNKSVDLSFKDLAAVHTKLTQRTKYFWDSTDNAYKTLLLLSFEFDYLVGPKYNPIGTLDKEISPMRITPQNLIGTFAKYKKLASRYAS